MEFTCDKGTMHYEVTGSGERTLLLLHGWGGSTESWIPVVRDFSDGCRVIAVDFPGFGKSPEPESVWSVTEYAHLLLAFIRSLEVETVDLIAHSFGGRVALMLSKLAPELVRRQVLTGCAGLPPRRSGLSKFKHTMFHMIASAADNSFTRSIAGDNAIEKARNAMRNRFGSADYKSASPVMKQILQTVVDQDLTECLQHVKASTLLIWGENDTATPLWMGQEMEKSIRDAGLVVFEGSGHFAYLEQYARFYAVSRKFLLG